jgi:hypothetical protein
MHELNPYTVEELQRIRRLIRAAGLDVREWCDRLRRSADWLQSLSPAQAAIVAQQATAIAQEPDELGPAEQFPHEVQEMAAVPESERQAYLSRQIILIRRVHYPPEE